MPVYYHYTDNITFLLENTPAITKWVEMAFRSESNRLFSFHFVFCDDAYLLEINQKFLSHDEYTDIITFTLEDTPKNLESEIYISVERIEENSRNFNIPFDTELKRVMIHGVLHLLGYADKDPEMKKEMRQKEDHWIQLFPSSN